MSNITIDKPDFDFLLKEHIPFTVIPNYVLQNYCDESLAMWCYLLSLPLDWEINRRHLMKKFKIGRDKLQKWLKNLRENHLIDYVWIRKNNGYVTKVAIKVCNGELYKEKIINNQTVNKEEVTTLLKSRSVDKTREIINTTEKPLCGKTAPTKENIYTKQNQRKKKKEERGKKRLSPTRTPIDDFFHFTEKHVLLSEQLFLDIQQEKFAFIDYYQANGKTMCNWDAAFNNWLRKSAMFKKRNAKKEHPVTSIIHEIQQDYSRMNDEQKKSMRDFMN